MLKASCFDMHVIINPEDFLARIIESKSDLHVDAA